MNESKFENEKMLPVIDYQSKKFMRLPNPTEMTFPDGTVYRVNSRYVAKLEMGAMLDALNLEK